MEDSSGGIVNAVGSGKEQRKGLVTETKCTRECWNCGRKHEYHKKELCPAYGKTCMKCHKLNHFAAKCRSGGNVAQSVKAVEDTEDKHRDLSGF